jgi:PAS domain-containing protein
VLKSGEHDAKFYKNLWETILSGRVWQGEMVNKRKDGRLYNEEMTITPVRDASGAISRFIAIKQNITERKRAEDELRHANARIQKLLSANVIGIAEFDATKIVSANRALLDMTGYGARDVARGRVDWREITPPEYAERDNRAWREMMEHGECHHTKGTSRANACPSHRRRKVDGGPSNRRVPEPGIPDWKLMEKTAGDNALRTTSSTPVSSAARSDNEGCSTRTMLLEMVGYTREDFEAVSSTDR